MELWDLYTEHREWTGETHVRGNKLPDDRFHLVVHVWIKNAKGEYLISQRSADRPTDPLMWECVGGSVIKGETSIQGALREVREELGIELSEESGKLLFSEIRKKYNDIVDVYLFYYDGDFKLENAETDEVAQAAWMNKNEIKNLFEQNKLIHNLAYFFTDQTNGMLNDN